MSFLVPRYRWQVYCAVLGSGGSGNFDFVHALAALNYCTEVLLAHLGHPSAQLVQSGPTNLLSRASSALSTE
ncbi:hypothetical protein TYRP_018369 [Tyrophagus putrescentiae]|nr:hypothetical protein TYRP_018369 [Tyrophagus putrescentiae]